MDGDEYLMVEYDLAYAGGDYDKTGEEVAIPVSLIDACGGDVEAAFERLTGHDRRHIIHYGNEVFSREDVREFWDESVFRFEKRGAVALPDTDSASGRTRLSGGHSHDSA